MTLNNDLKGFLTIDNISYPISTIAYRGNEDGVTFDIININSPDRYIVKGASYDNTINTDTGLAFTSLANVELFISKIAKSTNGESTIPTYASSIFIAVSTSVSGVTFVNFPSTPCNSLQVENNSGTAIEVRKGGSGVAIAIPSGVGGRYFSGISNANELSLRRVDTGAEQITITAEAITI